MGSASTHKHVHVSKKDSNGEPEVPSKEYKVELQKSAADTVTWLQGNRHTPSFKVQFNYPEGSPFNSKQFDAGQTSDTIVVEPNPEVVYRYTIYFPNGKSLDPGIIIK